MTFNRYERGQLQDIACNMGTLARAMEGTPLAALAIATRGQLDALLQQDQGRVEGRYARASAKTAAAALRTPRASA